MVRVRKNVRNLTLEEMDNLVRAFSGIQNLPADDPDSFWTIAGYHGEPFRGPGANDPDYWGGYCNHGNVLFATWHRAYILRIENALEKALQKVLPGATFAMPYWDETDEYSRQDGIPEIFLSKEYTLDGKTIPNPLFSYKFQKGTDDGVALDDTDYTKPAGYETVRYPFSGLVGPADKDATEIHNQKMEELGHDKTTALLNDNVKQWLNNSYYVIDDNIIHSAGCYDDIKKCLDAPNYTVFSNTTSATHWNEKNPNKLVVCCEQPHNKLHIAIGGFDVPDQPSRSQVTNANGDMGENETAGFDPIFFFHHCFFDLVFWQWQVKHDQRDSIEITAGYPGTNTNDGGPVAGQKPDTPITLDTPLDPFKLDDQTRPMTSRDVVNIANLGYDYAYSKGPLEEPPTNQSPAPILTVGNINRGATAGSFVVSAWAFPESGQPILVGTDAVLSRWNVAGCRNCQNHLEFRTHFPMVGWSKEDAEKMEYKVQMYTRNPRLPHTPGLPDTDSGPTIDLVTAHLG